jgi:hypothetical protein
VDVSAHFTLEALVLRTFEQEPATPTIDGEAEK